MVLKFLEYDIQPAVIAQRCLVFEAHIAAEVYDLVWSPTAETLDHLSRLCPPSLTCLAGKLYNPGKTLGGIRDVYLVLPNQDKSILYLLSAVTRPQAESLWADHLDRAKSGKRQDKVELLTKRGPTSIVREPFMCSVPVDSETLDESALRAAVRSYMRTFEPDLTALPIEWLPNQLALELEARIQDEAMQSARPQSEKERLQVFLRDEL